MTLTPIFVVILTMNLRDDTIACVESVLAAGVEKKRIVVVDNASTDDTVVGLVEHFGPDLMLICNQENLGCAGGVNKGVEYALKQGAASILVLNNDTVINRDMIRILLAAGETLEQPDILAPAIYYYDDPSRLWRLGDVRYHWLPMPLTVKVGKATASKSAPFRVDYVTGCAMLVRRQVFERIGLYDTRYYMYFEDPDFCRRALDAGFAVWVVPQARMWHKVSATTTSRKSPRGTFTTSTQQKTPMPAKRDKPFYRYYRIFSQMRFYHQHPHGPSALLREVYIIYKIARTLLGDIVHGDWDLIRPLWNAAVDGYREHLTRRPVNAGPHIRRQGSH